jgi:hypothetical protein
MGDRSWGPNPTVAEPVRSELAEFVTKLGPFDPGEILWIHDVEIGADDLDAIAAAIADMPNRPIVICTEPGATLETVGIEHLKALVARLEEDTNG